MVEELSGITPVDAAEVGKVWKREEIEGLLGKGEVHSHLVCSAVAPIGTLIRDFAPASLLKRKGHYCGCVYEFRSRW